MRSERGEKVKVIDRLIQQLELYAVSRPPSVINFEKVREVSVLYQKAADSLGENHKVILTPPDARYGFCSIEITGTDPITFASEELCELLEKADNFEVISYDGATVGITFGFYGLVNTV